MLEDQPGLIETIANSWFRRNCPGMASGFGLLYILPTRLPGTTRHMCEAATSPAHTPLIHSPRPRCQQYIEEQAGGEAAPSLSAFLRFVFETSWFSAWWFSCCFFNCFGCGSFQVVTLTTHQTYSRRLPESNAQAGQSGT